MTAQNPRVTSRYFPAPAQPSPPPGAAAQRQSPSSGGWLCLVEAREDGLGFGAEDLGKLLSDEGIELPMVEFIPGFKS